MKGNEIEIGKIRRKLWLLGVFKIPMIGFVKPRLLEINDENVRVLVRLKRRSRNHLNSMYFGALAVGADIAAGIHAFYFSEKLGQKVSFAFKGIQGDFLMRAESDIVFSSKEGLLVKQAMERSKESGERVNQPIKVVATDTNNNEVALFELIVSVRVK